MDEITTVAELKAARRGDDPSSPHLFPVLVAGAWDLSVQADHAGYACSPRVSLDVLGDYRTVEVGLRGPDGHLVHANVLGDLPESIARAFDTDSDDYPLGLNMTWDEVEFLAARMAEVAPSDAPGGMTP